MGGGSTVISPSSHRKEYRRWITEAKNEVTRTARLTKAVEMLKKESRRLWPVFTNDVSLSRLLTQLFR